MSFYEEIGPFVIGSRLRLLTDIITKDAADLYTLYDIPLQPKWFPVFYCLSDGESKGITDIAKIIQHSHPSVSNMVKEMKKAKLLVETKNSSDSRKTMVQLSEKGKQIAIKIKEQYTDVNSAISKLLLQTQNNLWKAIAEWEYLLEEQSLFNRVKEEKKQREQDHIQIIPYTNAHKEAFVQLNKEWIQHYFKMEESDFKALDHPEEYILNRGGHILVATYKNEVVGVCALIPMKDDLYDFELAKMAVSSAHRGLGIGYVLGKAIKHLAKEKGATKLYLESNTVLQPAIKLYQKLGFKKIVGRPTPYERCNIQMECTL
ncbi:GNAT family N-acetyltransferase [Zhouia sp. PK063]|uniref:bifunctional helix-turn-helix transcriptional regulator/GNAT family N-acetyltransferase n=1 Tax=Zhouia sp. PK063 TaxID=3373602 RepID=UPI0037914F37